MPKINVNGQMVQAGELGLTDRDTHTHTKGRTDGWTLPSTVSPSLRGR